MIKLKNLFVPVIFLIFSCTPQPDKTTPPPDNDIPEENSTDGLNDERSYGNERIKEVRVEKISEDTYHATGKAQIFEATLSYVVEDGHYELIKGFTTTDAGAPEFGNFDFTFSVKKREPHTTLILILFESSAKDGSRQHTLIIPLQE